MASRPPPPSYAQHQTSKKNLFQRQKSSPNQAPPQYQPPAPHHQQQAAPPQYTQPVYNIYNPPQQQQQQPIYYNNNTMTNVQRVMHHNNAQQPSFNNIFNPLTNNNIQYQQQPPPNYQYPPQQIIESNISQQQPPQYLLQSQQQQQQQHPIQPQYGYISNAPPTYIYQATPNIANTANTAPQSMSNNNIISIVETEEDRLAQSNDSDDDNHKISVYYAANNIATLVDEFNNDPVPSQSVNQYIQENEGKSDELQTNSYQSTKPYKRLNYDKEYGEVYIDSDEEHEYNKNNKDDDHYQWRLPQYNEKEIVLICRGYLRTRFGKIHNIPTKVMESIMDHFYKLDIINEEIVAVPTGSIVSEPIYFRTGPFKWTSYWFPNGRNLNNVGKVDWILRLLSLPTSISEIKFEFKILLIEKGDCYVSTAIFNHNELILNNDDFIPREDIINLKRLTFKIYIKILHIFNDKKEYMNYGNYGYYEISANRKDVNHYGDMITKSKRIKPLNLSYLPSGVFCFNAMDKELINSMKKYIAGNFKTTQIFEIKSFKFLMKMSPNGRNHEDAGNFSLELVLLTIPPKLSSICMILDTQLTSSGYIGPVFEHSYAIFNTFMPKHTMSVLCGKNLCRFEEFKKFNTFSLHLIMRFVDIYDIDGNSVINNYNNNIMNDCRLLSLPTNHYKWIPDDVDSIINGKNSEYFETEVFKLESFKWIFQIFPNGYIPSQHGEFAAFVYLACLSSKIEKVVAMIRLRVYGEGGNKLEFSFVTNGEYTANNCKLGWITTGIKSVDLLLITKLKFEISITIIDVFDIDGNDINDNYQSFQSPLSYTLNTNIGHRSWNIYTKDAISMLLNAKYCESFESGFFRLHKMKWNIKIYPNGNTNNTEKGDVILQIMLEELIKPIISLSVKYSFYIKETGTWFSNIAHFRDNDNLRNEWKLSHLNRDKLKMVDKLTIKLQLKLIDVFAKHHKVITNKYIFVENSKD